MLKAYALRFHRWITLVFALPLLVVIGTGLVLSVEPLAQRSGLDQPLDKARALELLRTHDPDGKATGLTLRAYENALTIAGVGPEESWSSISRPDRRRWTMAASPGRNSSAARVACMRRCCSISAGW